MAMEDINLDLTKYPIPRVRHHVSPQVYLPASQHHTLPAWYPPEIAAADNAAWFASGSANVLDIGAGRGGFLLRHALAFPEMNILGLEIRNMLVEWVNGVVDGEGLPNARALWYSVANGLGFIPDDSISYVTYLFADPWPKKRHHKRRAFTPELVSEIVRILAPEGKLFLASDVEGVMEQQQEVIEEQGALTIQPLSTSEWPFPFATDQQRFCDRKNIPYEMMVATRK